MAPSRPPNTTENRCVDFNGCTTYNVLQPSAHGIPCATHSRFDQHRGKARPFHSRRHVAVTTADIEHIPARRVVMQHGCQYPVAMAKPKRIVFERVTNLVPIIRIRNRLRGFSYPKARLVPRQICRSCRGATHRATSFPSSAHDVLSRMSRFRIGRTSCYGCRGRADKVWKS